MPAPANLADLYTLGNYIDSFALGHYARVLEAVDLRTQQTVAFKVMRPEHRAPDSTPKWEAQAFIHEARLLTILSGHSAPMKFWDCGYVSAESEYPAGGKIVSFGMDVGAFSAALYDSNAEGWRPYLSLEYLPRDYSLLYVMRSQQGERRRLPTEEGLDLAMQFGDLLAYAHQRHITYMDHKLEHLYWDGRTLRIIDWNSSKLLENAATLEQQQRKDIHNMCVGVLYPIFTGHSPQRGALRPQPGSMNEVDERYSNVNHLDFSADPTLSSTITGLLEAGAQQQIGTAQEFMQKLHRAAQRFGWMFPNQTSNPIMQQARQQVRDGLIKLRIAEDLTREARELFLSAGAMDGINEDMEQELRRLLKAINEFINTRVIP